jgi:hypothetical protein
MVSLDHYQAYRKTATALNHQIIDALVERAVLMRAARALDVARGDTFVFESEAEMNVLMDYALYEYRVQGKALVEVYREQTTPLTPMQRELLDGMCQSYTSLFRITEVHAAESTLVLADRLQQRADIPLIDIMFSRTVKPGMLLFTRVVPLSMMNMTAGIAFVFPGESEAHLLRRYKRLSKRVKADTESARRLVAFFQLNRTEGIEVAFA